MRTTSTSAMVLCARACSWTSCKRWRLSLITTRQSLWSSSSRVIGSIGLDQTTQIQTFRDRDSHF
eukprot:3067896-Amphidinium_carterae.1